jgi:hypothetical protein
MIIRQFIQDFMNCISQIGEFMFGQKIGKKKKEKFHIWCEHAFSIRKTLLSQPKPVTWKSWIIQLVLSS